MDCPRAVEHEKKAAEKAEELRRAPLRARGELELELDEPDGNDENQKQKGRVPVPSK